MLDTLKDIVLDTLIDGAKLLPFLFIAFLIIELIEHNVWTRMTTILTIILLLDWGTLAKTTAFGPFTVA